VAEAGDEINGRARWLAILERHEDHLIPGRILAIPASMLADEGAVRELRAHGRFGKVHAKGRYVRTQAVIGRDRSGDLVGILRPHTIIDMLPPVAVGPAIESAFLHR